MAAPSSVERTGVVKDSVTGELFLPESRRADGSIRKARKVKAGYVPPEEVPVYQNESVKWMKSRAGVPIGLSPDLVDKAKSAKESASRGHVMTNQEARSKQKQAAVEAGQQKKGVNNRKGGKKVVDEADGVDDLLASVYGIKVADDSSKKGGKAKKLPKGGDSGLAVQDADPAKKLKNLQKKLKSTEKLEEKIKSGELKQPAQQELDKVARRSELEKEIKDLQQKLEKS
ncbi:hypothetical protein LOTGIDRAFT_205412 [Lottia gigantea]|uniref:WIBG Mago-binding domain-containing protein n=1 Tax=Lottia gigantea TaxID=225164 RepID=V4AN71_LOTGI|nr:hypothetical protein LOTGIDRAFT_205412 [Lottia gigantea]ESO96225.1 hypothetical protein LOTGIDRAFT_205412 [Lottia gigantea]